MDAYHAPYRDQHRYWTGLLLCLRCVLLLVFAFNTQADPSLNLMAIGIVVIGLLTLTHFTGFIYKKLYLDILEISFILNLGILAVATYYAKFAVVPVSQAAVTYTSVGIAFTTFIGVSTWCISNSPILRNNYISLLSDLCTCVHVKKKWCRKGSHSSSVSSSNGLV